MPSYSTSMPPSSIAVTVTVMIEPRFTPPDGFGELVTAQRLDRQRDTLLVGVNIGDNGLDHVALAVLLDGFLAALIPV